MSKYKTLWITLCKNEEDIIPYVIPYWRIIADKVIVYDNHSTDSSVELLSKHDWIEIRTFDSDGQNDIIQKQVKEQAYLEYKNDYDIIIITDLDEVFYFNDFKAVQEAFITQQYNVLATPIVSLCEENKPPYTEDLLHKQCHMFYHKRMNHMEGFENYSKLSIFNTKASDKMLCSVGQHYVNTIPQTKVLISNDGFCLHIDKGLSKEFFIQKRMKMGVNLSQTNKKYGMGIEYLKSAEELEKEYMEYQTKAFDINK